MTGEKEKRLLWSADAKIVIDRGFLSIVINCLELCFIGVISWNMFHLVFLACMLGCAGKGECLHHASTLKYCSWSSENNCSCVENITIK